MPDSCDNRFEDLTWTPNTGFNYHFYSCRHLTDGGLSECPAVSLPSPSPSPPPATPAGPDINSADYCTETGLPFRWGSYNDWPAAGGQTGCMPNQEDDDTTSCGGEEMRSVLPTPLIRSRIAEPCAMQARAAPPLPSTTPIQARTRVHNVGSKSCPTRTPARLPAPCGPVATVQLVPLFTRAGIWARGRRRRRRRRRPLPWTWRWATASTGRASLTFYVRPLATRCPTRPPWKATAPRFRQPPPRRSSRTMGAGRAPCPKRTRKRAPSWAMAGAATRIKGPSVVLRPVGACTGAGSWPTAFNPSTKSAA